MESQRKLSINFRGLKFMIAAQSWDAVLRKCWYNQRVLSILLNFNYHQATSAKLIGRASMMLFGKLFSECDVIRIWRVANIWECDVTGSCDVIRIYLYEPF